VSNLWIGLYYLSGRHFIQAIFYSFIKYF